MSADVICEQCGKAKAEHGGWFCTPCTDSLLKSYVEGADVDGVEEDACSGCAAAPASLFGVCDDCYDAAYNTRSAGYLGTTARDHTPGWWEYESIAPATVPSFESEVTHHNLKASLAVV